MKATEEMIGDVPGSVLGMLADLNLKLKKGVLTPKQLEMFLKKQNPFAAQNAILDYSQIISEWKKFYKEIFNLETDFSRTKVLNIPEADDSEFPWFICVPEAKVLSNEQAFSGGKPQFNVWKYTNKPFDKVLDLSFGRDALKNPYIVRCRANYEADEDLKNLSANKIAEMKTDTLTLKERLLLGRFVYWKENKLLDRETITLCSGSRILDGNVPKADWYDSDGGLQVDWYYLGGAHDLLRSRAAVSI